MALRPWWYEKKGELEDLSEEQLKAISGGACSAEVTQKQNQ